MTTALSSEVELLAEEIVSRLDLFLAASSHRTIIPQGEVVDLALDLRNLLRNN